MNMAKKYFKNNILLAFDRIAPPNGVAGLIDEPIAILHQVQAKSGGSSFMQYILWIWTGKRFSRRKRR